MTVCCNLSWLLLYFKLLQDTAIIKQSVLESKHNVTLYVKRCAFIQPFTYDKIPFASSFGLSTLMNTFFKRILHHFPLMRSHCKYTGTFCENNQETLKYCFISNFPPENVHCHRIGIGLIVLVFSTLLSKLL